MGPTRLLINHVLRKDLWALNLRDIRVILVESAPHLLAPFHASLRSEADRRLKAIGIEIRYGATVQDMSDREIVFNDGSRMEAGTIVWTAGVMPTSLAGRLETAAASAAGIEVKQTLQLPGHPEVFAIGDIAVFTNESGGGCQCSPR